MNPQRIVRIGGAVATQGISSVANLLMALLVARELGPRGLGQYAFCLAALFLFVGMQTVWVGDSYTVLARESHKLRQGVLSTQVMHALVGAVLIVPVARFGCDASWTASLVMGGLLVAWEFEEFGRRVLMAHQQFWRQGCADLIYLAFAVGSLMIMSAETDMTLELALLAMTIGAVAAFVASQLLLSSERRFRTARWDSEAVKVIYDYGVWRAAQSGSGLAVQLGVRFVIVGIVSLVALGQLEAARLVTAPLFTLVASVNNVVLPALVPLVGAGMEAIRRRVVLITVGVSAACLVYAIIAISLAPQLTHWLAGSEFAPSRTAVAAWCLLGLVTAVVLPASTAGTIVLKPSLVFRNRLAGSLAGLVLVIPLAYWDVSLVPLGLAAGLLISGAFLAHQALSSPRWLATKGG